MWATGSFPIPSLQTATGNHGTVTLGEQIQTQVTLVHRWAESKGKWQATSILDDMYSCLLFLWSFIFDLWVKFQPQKNKGTIFMVNWQRYLCTTFRLIYLSNQCQLKSFLESIWINLKDHETVIKEHKLLLPLPYPSYMDNWAELKVKSQEYGYICCCLLSSC